MENIDEVEEDFLNVDHKVPGQNFVCLSFIIPTTLYGGIPIFRDNNWITPIKYENMLTPNKNKPAMTILSD